MDVQRRRADARSLVPLPVGPDRPARVGLLPHEGTAGSIRWCDVDPCYVFHPVNAYDGPDGTVVVDVVRYPSVFVVWQSLDRSRS